MYVLIGLLNMDQDCFGKNINFKICPWVMEAAM